METFKIGDAVRFKIGCIYHYGVVDAVDGGWCEISYGNKKQFNANWKIGCPLDYFADIRINELELFNPNNQTK